MVGDAGLKVTHLIDDLAQGGAQTMLIDLLRASSLENEVYYIGSRDNLEPEVEENAEVVGLGGQFRFDPRPVVRLLSAVRRDDVEILHTHLPYAHVVGRVCAPLGVSVIATYHNVSHDYFSDIKLRLIERATAGIDDVKVACSHGVLDSYSDAGGNWIAIPNGLDVTRFQGRIADADTGNLESRYGFEEGDHVVLSVGRYVPKKNQDTLIRAMAEVVDKRPDTHLLLVGRGPLEADLKRDVRSRGLGGNITVTGYVEDIYAHYALADTFVLPSLSEGLPIALLEAIAARCPVVATDIPGVREVIEDGETGLLVSPHSATEMGRALVSLRDPDRRERFVERALAMVNERYTIERMAEEYEHLYREVRESRTVG